MSADATTDLAAEVRQLRDVLRLPQQADDRGDIESEQLSRSTSCTSATTARPCPCRPQKSRSRRHHTSTSTDAFA
jgi:hypothetical protein